MLVSRVSSNGRNLVVVLPVLFDVDIQRLEYMKRARDKCLDLAIVTVFLEDPFARLWRRRRQILPFF